MKLEQWLKLNKLTTREFAEQIGKSPSLVHKYLYEGVTPQRSSMQAIFRATHGAVTANDFYKLTPDLLEQDNYGHFRKW